jgi:hypothetical protein
MSLAKNITNITKNSRQPRTSHSQNSCRKGLLCQ